jgi:hypothetical protein
VVALLRSLVLRRGVVWLVGLCAACGALASVASASPAVPLKGMWMLTDTCRSSCAGATYSCTLPIKETTTDLLGGGCNGAKLKGTQTGDAAKWLWIYPGEASATFTIHENEAGTKFTGTYRYPDGQHGTCVATRIGTAPTSSP